MTVRVPPNLFIDGKEVAPDACIVCGASLRTVRYVYLSGASPIGSCACTDHVWQALQRCAATGRCDPEYNWPDGYVPTVPE